MINEENKLELEINKKMEEEINTNFLNVNGSKIRILSEKKEELLSIRKTKLKELC